MITILLADSHPVVRQGITTWLAAEADMQVAGEASDGLEACDQAERLQPAVVVLDMAMPSLDALEAIRQLHVRSPHSRVVVFSARVDEAVVLRALAAGAVAVVPKEAPAAQVLQAIREAAHGRRYLPQPYLGLAMEAYAASARPQSDALQSLTERERQVLYLVVQGRTNSEIARLTFLSRRTVEGHRASMMHKLGLRSLMDVLSFALRQGILSFDR